MKLMRRREWIGAVGSGMAVLAGACRSPGKADGGLEGRVEEETHEASLHFRGRPVLTYVFGPGQYKPYVREWNTLRGENLLRDAPSDHLHHHGLMYAIRVNGANFWEEREPAGRQVSMGAPGWTLGRSRDGMARAVLEHRIRWQPPGEASPDRALLLETRRLTVTVSPGWEEVALEWESRFQVGPGSERVRLEGAVYHGLGLRLPAALDHVAEFRNSAGEAYSEAQTQDLKRASWTAVAGRVEGREVMVGMAADARNAGTSTFFTMRNAFAYLAATQDLATRPLEYARGTEFGLRYLLVAYPAHQNERFLADRFGAWRPAA